MEICKLEKCTGCFACKNICPKDAIITVEDKLGKTIPAVDDKICINCGLCRKVCPINYPVKFNTPKFVYAAWSKNENDILLSSSGGVATVFANCVVSDDGIVFGSASINKTVKHMSATSALEIEKLRGSKYVQSYIGNIFREVKEKLISGIFVLFIGTPCQIAGLRNYLCNDFNNLITVDLICHGTPPISYLNEHLSYIIKKSNSWDSVSFRGKYDFILTAYNKNKIVYKKKQNEDTYFRAFLDGLTYRDNCYECMYAKPERISDITVADFWGIDRSKMKHSYDGRISLIMVNTDKGSAFFEKNKDELVWEEHTLAEAMSPVQTNIHHPSIPHNDRKTFEKNYVNFGFEKAVNKTEVGKRIRNNKIKRLTGFHILKKIVKRILNKV